MEHWIKKHMRREIEMKSDVIDLVRDYIWTKMLIIQVGVRFDSLYTT